MTIVVGVQLQQASPQPSARVQNGISPTEWCKMEVAIGFLVAFYVQEVSLTAAEG